MTRSILLLLAAAIAAAPSAIAAAQDTADHPPPPKTPSLMTPTEIKAYNEGLAVNHRFYIKCRKSLEIGSLVKKNRVCHTNEQWKDVSAKANQDARDTVEAMTSKATNGAN